MHEFRFDPCRLPPEAETLRREVRAFLAEALTDIPAVTRAQTWSGYDPAFSRKLGEMGWIGMTWPKKYGGQERTVRTGSATGRAGRSCCDLAPKNNGRKFSPGLQKANCFSVLV